MGNISLWWVPNHLHFIFFPWQELSEFNSTAVKSPTNTVTVQNLKAGTIYVFQVRARTVAGYGRYSGKMYFQTMTEGKTEGEAGVCTGQRICPLTWPNSNILILVCLSAEYQTSIQEKLPLIIGSSAAGLVFIIALVVLILVCNR